jgi:hypothetical protein
MSTRLSKGRSPDRPHRSPSEFSFNGKQDEGLSRATRSPRRCWPMTRCWSGAVVQISPPARHRGLGCRRTERAGQPWQGARFEPNQRTTTTELFDGRWPRPARTTGPALSSTWARSTTTFALPARRVLLQDLHVPAFSGNMCSSRSSAVGGPWARCRGARCRPLRICLCLLRSGVVGGGIAGLEGREGGPAGKRVSWSSRPPLGRPRAGRRNRG